MVLTCMWRVLVWDLNKNETALIDNLFCKFYKVFVWKETLAGHVMNEVHAWVRADGDMFVVYKIVQK